MAPIYSVAAVAVGIEIATIQGRFSHEGTVMPLPPAATDAGANRWMAHHLAPASDRDSAGGSVLVRPPSLLGLPPSRRFIAFVAGRSLPAMIGAPAVKLAPHQRFALEADSAPCLSSVPMCRPRSHVDGRARVRHLSGVAHRTCPLRLAAIPGWLASGAGALQVSRSRAR